MVIFMAHIAVILEILAAAAGLVALHYAAKLHAKFIKAAGVLLLVFGIGGFICTGYYAIKYYLKDHYENPYGLNMIIEGNGTHHHYSVGD